MCRIGRHKTLCRVRVFIGQGWLAFRPPGCVLEERHQNMRRSRVTARPDLKPPKGLGLGLGSGRSGSTCNVEITDTSPAQSLVPTSPAHSGSRFDFLTDRPLALKTTVAWYAKGSLDAAPKIYRGPRIGVAYLLLSATESNADEYLRARFTWALLRARRQHRPCRVFDSAGTCWHHSRLLGAGGAHASRSVYNDSVFSAAPLPGIAPR